MIEEDEDGGGTNAAGSDAGDNNSSSSSSPDLAKDYAANIQGLETWTDKMIQEYPVELELAVQDESDTLPKNDELGKQIKSAGEKFGLAPKVVWVRLKKKFKQSFRFRQTTTRALRELAKEMVERYDAAIRAAEARRLQDLDDEAVEQVEEDEESNIDAELEAEIEEAAEKFGVDEKEVRQHLQEAVREKHFEERESTRGEKPPAEIPGTNLKRYGKYWVSSEPCGVWYEDGEVFGLAGVFRWRRCTKDRLDPICHSYDIDGKKPHVDVLLTKPNGESKEIEIACRDIVIETNPNPAAKKITDEGVRVIRSRRARAALIDHLNFYDPNYRRIRVSQTGWLRIEDGRWAFILAEPFGTLMPKDLLRIAKPSRRQRKLKPEPRIDYVLDGGVGNGCGLAIKGTLEDWNEQIAKLLEGNSNVALHLGTAFAAPLLLFAGEQAGGAHNHGLSGKGKSLGLATGQSVYGRPINTVGEGPTFGRPWRSTANGFEGFARERNDLPMFLDELHLADPREVRAVIYMITEGSGKMRMNSNLTLHKQANFRTLLGSTGELSMTDFLRDDAEGRRKRVPDVPAIAREDGSALESIADAHMVMAGKTFYGRMATQHGAVGKAYLQALVDLGPNQIKQGIEHHRGELLELPQVKALMRDADAQVASVVSRFVLDAIGLRMAVETKVLWWSIESCDRGIMLAMQRWAAARGELGVPGEILTTARRIRDQIRAHLNRRYLHLRKAREGKTCRLIPSRPEDAVNFTNWRALLASAALEGLVRFGEQGAIENILVCRYAFERLCNGRDSKTVARYLGDKGYLEQNAEGGLTKTETLDGGTSTRFYVLKPHFLEGESEQEKSPQPVSP